MFDTDTRIAPAFVLFDSLFLFAIVWLPLLFLISASSLVFNISILLMLYSYIKLKKLSPEAGWLYSFGWVYGALLSVPPVVITFVMYAGVWNLRMIVAGFTTPLLSIQRSSVCHTSIS